MMQAFRVVHPGRRQAWKWLGDTPSALPTSVSPPSGSLSPRVRLLEHRLRHHGPLGSRRVPHPGEEGPNAQTRTKYGTRQELEEAMQELRKNGISIYVDAVLNHRMGANEKQTFKAVWSIRTIAPSSSRNRTTSRAGPSLISPTARASTRTSMGFRALYGVDWDAKTETKAIFRIEGDNKHGLPTSTRRNGNYDFLMGADVRPRPPRRREGPPQLGCLDDA